MAGNEIFSVQFATTKRKSVRVYFDFLASNLLSTEEKMVFIALKSFVEFGKDEDNVYPSMEKLCSLTSMSRPRATRAINGLVKKGVIKKIRRGLTKTNLYIIADHAAMWATEDLDELKSLAESTIPYSTDALIEELIRRGVILKQEKEPATVGADAGSSDKLNIVLTTNNNNPSNDSSQERYSLQALKDLYDYATIVHDQRCSSADLDAVMDVIYETVNTTKKSVRISGEQKPTEAVIAKLLKLSCDEILYVIEKYSEQTGRIKNPKAYLLTMLYGAQEQMHLDIKNQVSHDLMKGADDTE